MCRVRMGRGRCLVADKILRYLQNNSMIKIGHICDSKEKSLEIDERMGQRIEEKITSEDVKSTENLHTKRSAFLPFKLKLKTITFWKDSWNKLKSIFKHKSTSFKFEIYPVQRTSSPFIRRLKLSDCEWKKWKENNSIAHECRKPAISSKELDIDSLVCVWLLFTLHTMFR